MNSETYDQIEVPLKKLGDLAKYLKDNMDATGIYINNQLFNVELPIKVPLKIAQTVPGVKGDTVANTTKEATLETGAVIKVPLFINEGDTVLVDTRTGAYVERVNG
jgi:elongation factor P